MSILDWLVLCGTLIFIIAYGVWKTRNTSDMKAFVLGDNSNKWWTIGLGVMATQASAITFLSTPGQAYHDGMGFVQFYFGLPLAMIFVSIFFIPLYYRLKVYTAYELLENRFDLKTRTFTAFLFLIQRGLAAGITIYAPSIILSTILGWNLSLLNVIIGLIVIIYVIMGGNKAISVTHKQQMLVIMIGMVWAFIMVIQGMPDNVSFSRAMDIAHMANKFDVLDFSINLENRYTFWSGITGGFFLALAYFGTDQSQVGRYLSGKSIKESQVGLIFNGLLKVPMQFFILWLGVMVFVFYQFEKPPIFFNNATISKLEASKVSPEYKQLLFQYDSLFENKKLLLTRSNNQEDKTQLTAYWQKEKELRNEVKSLISNNLSGDEPNDKDYLFISFVLAYLPKGVIGLLLAVIFCAAMSSTASELSALSTTMTVDIYKRSIRPSKDEKHYVRSTRWFTVMWGVIAILFASFGTLFENLIQFVNIIGSIFYGTILGVFLVAIFMKFVKGNAVFTAAVCTQIIIILIYNFGNIGYLWLNLIGAALVVRLSLIFQLLWTCFSYKNDAT